MQTNENQSSAGDASIREKVLSEANISEQSRSKIDLLFQSRPEWNNVASYLYNNNYDKAYDFLVRLLKIDPKAQESEKASVLLSILNEYSEYSALHSKDVFRLINDTGVYKNDPKYKAFQNIDFSSLATAMERHDIGKLGMPLSVLHKNGDYTIEDHRIKETHPVLGYMILKTLGFNGKSLRLALTHHLKYKTLPNGELQIAGYPKEEFQKNCEERGEKFELTAEDQLASFSDVFSALMDVRRTTDIYGMKNANMDDLQKCKKAFKVMDNQIFNDPYYTTGEGAQLYSAFKSAMTEALEQKMQMAAVA